MPNEELPRSRNEDLPARDREAFGADGSLRDLYIKGTDLAAWQRFVDHLVRTYDTEFVREPRETTPPPVAEIFATRQDHSPTLRVDVHGLRINTHFFTEDEIELDLDPAEIRSQNDLVHLLAFMRELGELLDREVVLTPENADDVPIYRYRPRGGWPEYVPPPFR